MIAGALLTFGAVAAFAQYTGPSEYTSPFAGKKGVKTLHTVSEIREQGKDDQPVVLTGVLAKKTGRQEYLFKDATGEITVEIDKEDFPAAKVDQNTRVEIIGEVDKDALRALEVDADHVRIVPKE